MKANKLIARALVLLGFGAAAGLTTGCGASRASKSSTPDPPAADYAPVRVMYGVSSAQFDPDKTIRQRTVDQRAVNQSTIDQRAVGRVVTGRVTDADSGEPLIGVSVVSAGDPSRGTFTRLEGRYSLDAGATDSVFFQFYGYLRQTVKITGDTLDVRMKEDHRLDNIVVMYGVRAARFDPDKPVPSEPETEQNPADESR